MRVPVPRWFDPYWGIQGSTIEKMVMAELARRGIYFVHTPQTNDLGGFVDPSWEPDFLLPQHKIWIEVQGAYFHTLPGAVERDALRFAMIEAAGWRPVALWEDDIRARLPELLDAIPELYNVNASVQTGPTTLGLPFLEGGDGIDHLAGLRKALSGRAKPPQTQFRRAKKPKKRSR